MITESYYKHVKEIVDEGTKRFFPRLKIDWQKYEHLPHICSWVDKLAECMNTEYIEFKVDEIAAQLRITFACEDVILYMGDNLLLNTIELFDSFTLSKDNDNNLVCISMNVDHLWRVSNE